MPESKVAEDITVKRTICPLCATGCNAVVHIQNGRPVRIKADPKGPVPATGCVKFTGALDYHDHPARLNFPMKRVGQRGEGRWERVSWEQAMDEITEKLARIKDKWGPEALLGVGGSGHGPGDPNLWRFCNLWGTPNYFHQGKNCGEPEYFAEWAVYGAISEIGNTPVPGVTKCVIIWGSNPPVSYGSNWWKAAEAARTQGMKIITVDPRLSESAKGSDLWLQIRPGTDGALAYGMLKLIIDEGLYDADFVNRWCLGFEELKAFVAQYSLSKVEAITWVPAAKIAEAARLYATSKPADIMFGLGTAHQGKGTFSAVLGKAFLRAITGNVDVLGGNRFGDVPEQTSFVEQMHWDKIIDHPERTRDNVSSEVWPYGSVKALKLFREAMSNVYPKGLPGPAKYMIYPAPSSVWTAILDQKPYPIRAALIQASNTLGTFANSKRIAQAFTSGNLELLVVLEQNLTPTAQLADYVLPAADALETPNIFVAVGYWGFNDLYNAIPRALDPLYERRTDYDVFRDLGNRLGQQGYWPDSLEGWYDRLLEPSSVKFEELAARNDPQLAPPVREKRYLTSGFATASGKVEFSSSMLKKLGYDPFPQHEEPAWSPVSNPELAKEYPYILITTGRNRHFQGSNLHQIAKLRRLHPHPLVQLHPETARQLGIAEGDDVYIETPVGRVRQKARLFKGINPQVVHAEFGWWYPERTPDSSLSGIWESNINSIVPDGPEHASFTGDSSFRALLCRVYPAKESAPGSIAH
ncbi:MAG: molybdopterin oxidoreductase [Gammaproteobacteria bacterium]|nr:MAG: molybdopterin oxidoreductase [Gammaproteobacteria bacterium]